MKKIIRKANKYALMQRKTIGPFSFTSRDIRDAYIAGALKYSEDNQDGPDWEQRRYEIAKAVAAGIATSIRPWEPTEPKNRAAACIEFTDELIKQLKGE